MLTETLTDFDLALLDEDPVEILDETFVDEHADLRSTAKRVLGTLPGVKKVIVGVVDDVFLVQVRGGDVACVRQAAETIKPDGLSIDLLFSPA